MTQSSTDLEKTLQIDLPNSFVRSFLMKSKMNLLLKNTTPFDACAWYSPIHFHLHDWGIYIKSD